MAAPAFRLSVAQPRTPAGPDAEENAARAAELAARAADGGGLYDFHTPLGANQQVRV